MGLDKEAQKASIEKAKRLAKLKKQEMLKQERVKAELARDESEKKVVEFEAAFEANKLHAEKVKAIKAEREKMKDFSVEEDEVFYDAVEGVVEKNTIMNAVLNDIDAKRIELGRKKLQDKQLAVEARQKEFLGKRVATINTKGRHEDAIKRKVSVMKEIEEVIAGRKRLNDPKVVDLLKVNGIFESSLQRLEAAEMRLFGEKNPSREIVVSSVSNAVKTVDQEKIESPILLIRNATEEEKMKMMRDDQEKKNNELQGEFSQHSILNSKPAKKISIFDIPSTELGGGDQEMHNAARKIKEQYAMMKEDDLAKSIISAQKREEQKQKEKEMHYKESVGLRSKAAIQLKGKELFSSCLEDSQLILAEGGTDIKVNEYKELLQNRFLKSIEASVKAVSNNREIDQSYKSPLTEMINKAVDKLVAEIKDGRNSISDELAKKERSWFNIPGKLYDSFSGMFHKAALMMGKIEPTAAEVFEEAAKYSNDMKQKIEKQQAIDNKRARGKGPLASLINHSRGFRSGIVNVDGSSFASKENKRRSLEASLLVH